MITAMDATPGIEIRAVAADAPVAAALRSAVDDELRRLYAGVIDARLEDTPSAGPRDFAPPGGAFLVAFEDGRPVACGGIKQLAPGTGEVKRMYVVPAARGRGHARRLLAALERTAAELGHRRMRLDTGPRQPHARALYESAGYEPIPDYNGNPFAAHWFEKDLPGPAGGPARGAGPG